MRSFIALLEVVAAVLFGGALYFGWAALRRWRELARLRSWRPVPATLEDARFESLDGEEVLLTVRFRFEVDGSRFVGQTLERALSGPLPRARAEEYLLALRMKKELVARVDPAGPELSVLESGAVPPPLMLWAMAAGLALVSVAVAAGAMSAPQ
jgi:hypothetical protein